MTTSEVQPKSLDYSKDLTTAVSELQSEVAALKSNFDQIANALEAFALEIPVPLDAFKPGAGSGAVATPFAGTDPNVGDPKGGADKGGSGGYGVQQTAKFYTG